MAQHSLKLSGARSDRKALALDLEKLGIIAGFLFGLPIGIALLEGPLTEFDLPQWMVVATTFIVVAMFTWVGLRAGSVAAERLDQDTSDL